MAVEPEDHVACENVIDWEEPRFCSLVESTLGKITHLNRRDSITNRTPSVSSVVVSGSMSLSQVILYDEGHEFNVISL